jgi:hypothetical protein
MSIIAKTNGEKEFAKLPLPEPGTTLAVCCGVWDLGLQATPFIDEKTGEPKVQHKVIIAWEIAEKINEPTSEYHGKPYMLNKKYTLSLGEKANLRKDLESWRGKPFGKEELENGFDVEKLYGINCLIGIAHEPDRKDASKVYARVTAILPPAKGMEKMIPVRAKDELPPKWVLEKMGQAVQPAESVDDAWPFGDPAMDEMPSAVSTGGPDYVAGIG